MLTTIQALICKKWKDADLDLPIGKTMIDEEIVVRVTGVVTKGEDSFCTPTVSIPLITTLAFCFEKLGVDRDIVAPVLREAIREAMLLEQNEDGSILSRVRHVSEAVEFVKKEILQNLPKMRRTGRIDTKQMLVTVESASPAALYVA
jgi:hypothetical protein